MSTLINEKIFGKNDIRGIVGEGIDASTFKLIGKAYAKYIFDRLTEDEKNDIWVSVARDARTHSEKLTTALISGLTSSGINVLDIGLSPTPLGYCSEFLELNKKLFGTLVVTASHNPPEYNGLKMTFKKVGLSEENIQEVKEIVKSEDFLKSYKIGFRKKQSIVPDYIEVISNSFPKINVKTKIVVDSGNGTGGVVAPELYRDLGCEVIDICTEPDGNFPNHHPDPSKEKNLEMLKNKILETGADFGIAFDGDSDRIGIVDNTGYSLPGDQLLLIYALDILKELKSRGEKPVFISEVKCSQVLFDTINENGGEAIMWKTGHGYIKGKMKQEHAVLAGEMSGHIFFADRYYGFDDAVYAGCRFIEIFAKNKLQNPDFKSSDLVNALPKAYTSREVRKPCPNEAKEPVIDALRQEIKKNPNIFGNKIEDINTLDGMRIIFKGGFALIRASNTEPTFTLRFESDNQETTQKYQDIMLDLIDKKLEELQSAIK